MKKVARRSRSWPKPSCPARSRASRSNRSARASCRCRTMRHARRPRRGSGSRAACRRTRSSSRTRRTGCCSRSPTRTSNPNVSAKAVCSWPLPTRRPRGATRSRYATYLGYTPQACELLQRVHTLARRRAAATGRNTPACACRWSSWTSCQAIPHGGSARNAALRPKPKKRGARARNAHSKSSQP